MRRKKKKGIVGKGRSCERIDERFLNVKFIQSNVQGRWVCLHERNPNLTRFSLQGEFVKSKKLAMAS